MPETVNPQVLDSITTTDVKTLGETGALAAAASQQNLVQQQQRVNDLANSVLANSMNSAQQLAQLAGQQALQISADAAALRMAMLGRVTRHVLDLSGEQAAAFEKVLGAEIQDKISEIGGSLAGLQEFIKTAQTTPPQTGTGGAFGSETGLSQQIGLALASLAASQAAIVEMLKGKTA